MHLLKRTGSKQSSYSNTIFDSDVSPVTTPTLRSQRIDSEGDVQFDEYSPSSSRSPIPGTSSPTRPSSTSYEISPSFDIPYPLKNAIDNLDTSYFQDIEFRLSGRIDQGICYIILPTEMYIWSMDKPTTYDRVELPQQMDERQIVVTRNKKNYDTFSLFYCSKDGAVRYIPQTNRPNISQDISLDYRSSVDSVFISECDPYGVIVGNSNGTIHMISINQSKGGLVSKIINKSQGLLGYLYLARQSPVVDIVSLSAQTSGTSRFTYVLTESSLIKYQIVDQTEKILLDYSLGRDIQNLFFGFTNLRVEQLFIIESNTTASDEFDEVFILLKQSLPNSKKYYLMSLHVKQNNQVTDIFKIDQFNFVINLQDKYSNFEPKLNVIDKKYYLCGVDYIYYMSSYKEKVYGEIKCDNLIMTSGVWKNRLYFMDRQNRIQILNILPFSISELYDQIDDTITNTIKFDIPEEEDEIGQKRNTVLKALNSYTSKKQNILMQSLDACKKIPVEEFDAAIKRVSLYISDQKPLVRYWASSNDALKNLGTTASVQLKQQLDDKRNRHTIFIQFLKEYRFWNNLSPECQELIDQNDRRIKSSIDLREYQNLQQKQQQQQQQQQQQIQDSKSTTIGGVQATSTSTFLLPKLIQLVVEDRMGPNWANSGMTLYESFYSLVTMIDDLMVRVVIEMKESSKHTDTLVKLKQTMECNTIFLKIIANYNNDMLYTPLKGTNETVAVLIKQMIDHNTKLIRVDLNGGAATFLRSQNDANLSASETALFSQLHELTKRYLYVVVEKNQDKMDQVEKQITQSLSVFVESSRFHLANELAQLFRNYQTMIDVYVGDVDHRVEQLNTLQTNFAIFLQSSKIESVYLYMLERGLSLELLQLPEAFKKTRDQFLKQYPRLQWLNCLEQKQYNKTSEILLQECDKETTSLSRKQTLASISKLSALAESKQPLINLNQVIENINQKLELIKIQKEFLPHHKLILSVEEMIRQVLQLNELQPLERCHICLTTLEESKQIISLQERMQLLKLILTTSLDDGSLLKMVNDLVAVQNNVSDQQFDLMILQLDFYQLLQILPRDLDLPPIINTIIQEYYKETSKSIKDAIQKQYLNRILARVLELYQSK